MPSEPPLTAGDQGWPVLFGRAVNEFEAFGPTLRERFRPQLLSALRGGKPGLFRVVVDGFEVVYQVRPIATGHLAVYLHEAVRVPDQA